MNFEIFERISPLKKIFMILGKKLFFININFFK